MASSQKDHDLAKGDARLLTVKKDARERRVMALSTALERMEGQSFEDRPHITKLGATVPCNEAVREVLVRSLCEVHGCCQLRLLLGCLKVGGAAANFVFSWTA